MSWFDFFRRRGSAPVARERLQILLSHERAAARGEPDLLAVITKHITIDHEKVDVSMDRGATVSTLEINVEIPNPAGLLAAAAT